MNKLFFCLSYYLLAELCTEGRGSGSHQTPRSREGGQGDLEDGQEHREQALGTNYVSVLLSRVQRRLLVLHLVLCIILVLYFILYPHFYCMQSLPGVHGTSVTCRDTVQGRELHSAHCSRNNDDGVQGIGLASPSASLLQWQGGSSLEGLAGAEAEPADGGRGLGLGADSGQGLVSSPALAWPLPSSSTPIADGEEGFEIDENARNSLSTPFPTHTPQVTSTPTPYSRASAAFSSSSSSQSSPSSFPPPPSEYAFSCGEIAGSLTVQWMARTNNQGTGSAEGSRAFSMGVYSAANRNACQALLVSLARGLARRAFELNRGARYIDWPYLHFFKLRSQPFINAFLLTETKARCFAHRGRPSRSAQSCWLEGSA